MWFVMVIIVAFLTWFLPLPGKFIVLGINFFLPDGVPFIDEIIQIVGIVKSMKKNRTS
ncbi:MAG: hypothetical protein KBT36_13350 [Kurthia sp.]|nr:hypothetical protein [Candidatus Kurthia equi]